MFSILLALFVVSAKINCLQCSPITMDIMYFTQSNFTPVITDHIRQSAVKQVTTSQSELNVSIFQRDDQQHFQKLDLLTSDRLEDSIQFMDVENDTLEEGSLCKRKTDGAGGYCLLITQCRHVMREYQKFGTKIDICGYDGPIPIVCCPLTSRRGRKRRLKSNKRISAKYCEEYSKLGTRRGSFMRLVDTPVVMEIETETSCNFPVPLIVGGENASPGEFPHMAAIGWTRGDKKVKWSCGGSLISDRFVLTAAHCGQMAGNPPTIVRLGAHNLNTADDASPHFKDLRIVSIIKHPSYDPTAYYHDIALIKLDRKVQFSQFIRPACLWQSQDINMTSITATGWGRLGFHGRKAESLQKVNLNLIDRATCNGIFERHKELHSGIVDSQICAGHLEGGKDTCQGDSGGPLQVVMPDNRCAYHVIGITSFGKLCAAPNMPGVYTNINSYLDWIEGIVFER